MRLNIFCSNTKGKVNTKNYEYTSSILVLWFKTCEEPCAY